MYFYGRGRWGWGENLPACCGMMRPLKHANQGQPWTASGKGLCMVQGKVIKIFIRSVNPKGNDIFYKSYQLVSDSTTQVWNHLWFFILQRLLSKWNLWHTLQSLRWTNLARPVAGMLQRVHQAKAWRAAPSPEWYCSQSCDRLYSLGWVAHLGLRLNSDLVVAWTHQHFYVFQYL